MKDNPDDIGALSAFTQVGHALFARDGVKLAFGRRWDGQLIHISQAERGAACGCQCPAKNCRRKLIARKPESDIAHHFSHARLTPAERAAGRASNCTYGPMTALHAYAEKLLDEKKRLVLPPVTATLGTRSRTIRSAKEFGFDFAKLETMDGETIPDVILFKHGHRMHIEVFVTHRCGPEKRGKIVAANISAVEINLSGLPRDVTVAGLDEAILNSAPREWIHNRRAHEALNALKEEARAEARRAAKERQQTIDRLKQAYANALEQALASDWKLAEDVANINVAGDAQFLNGESGGDGYFSVHPNVWKAAVLNLLHDRFGKASPGLMIAEFARRGWLVSCFRSLEHDDTSLVSEAGLPSGGPEQAVVNFLQYLTRKGVAAYDGWRWRYTAGHSSELDRRALEKQRTAREAAERASRHVRLANLVKDIVLTVGADEAGAFNFDAWAIDGIGQTARHVTDAGGVAWRDLNKALSTTLAVLNDESEETAPHFGLPIREALQAMRATHEARADQRRLEAEEAKQKERQARIDSIERQARASLYEESDAWLDSPSSKLDGQTPRAAAAESPAKLATARWLLDQHCAARTLKARWVDELEREVTSLLHREEPDPSRLKTKVTLYMTGSDLKLPGHASPMAHTKDEVTMRECLAILKRRSGKRW
jgi:hypothetical protein